MEMYREIAYVVCRLHENRSVLYIKGWETVPKDVTLFHRTFTVFRNYTKTVKIDEEKKSAKITNWKFVDLN